MQAPGDDRALDYDARADDYYERKMQHREEILPYLIAVFFGAIACGSVVLAWTAVT